MSVPAPIARVGRFMTQSPKEITIPIAVLLVFLLAYGLIFLIPKPVTFSYAGKTCVPQLTILPDTYASETPETYQAYPSDVVMAGDTPLVATKMCFAPTVAPQAGTNVVSWAPGGGLFMKKQFAVTADNPPLASAELLDKPVPATKPLKITLSAPDEIHSYGLLVDGKKVSCDVESNVALCDIESLKLKQGTDYDAAITRQFADSRATLASKRLSVLPATTVKKTSINQKQTVFNKPKEVTFQFDKPLETADVTVRAKQGDDAKELKSNVTMSEKTLTVAFDGDLPRMNDVSVTVDELEATDGSGLIDPYKLNFKTSGGPKVTGISIPKTGVERGTTATITFDQSLADNQEIAKLIKTTGGAKVASAQGNQVTVATSDVAKCADFSIAINDKLKSKHGITGGTKWKFSARAKCHSTSVIGYSGEGRAITAYNFGDGGRTIVYTGAIHGNEYSTKQLMEEWVAHLEANARNIPKGTSVVVVPAINPDGVAAGSRTNGNNVDLNRNFGTNDWQKDITTVGNQPFKGGGGKSAMSEPETKAIGAFIGSLRPALVLSYHSVGSLVAANQTGISNQKASQYAQHTGYRNTTGQSDTFEYAISGTADDYYAQKFGVPSVLIELGSHSYVPFDFHRNAMWAMIK